MTRHIKIDLYTVENKDDYIYYLEEKYYAMSYELEKYKKEAEKTEHYKKLAHTYKVELGRCVRKLTRIYERQLEVAVLAYAFGKLNMQPHEYVDMWRQT